MKNKYNDDNNDMEQESREEDPMGGQAGKYCTPKTTKGEKMARMLVSFCCLPKSMNNVIVIYFDTSTMDKLANFYEEP